MCSSENNNLHLALKGGGKNTSKQVTTQAESPTATPQLSLVLMDRSHMLPFDVFKAGACGS